MTASKYSRYYTFIKPVITNKTVQSVSSYIFSLITIAIFIVFAIRPTISTILSLQKEIEENREILTALKTKANNLAEGKRNLQNFGPQTRAKINNAVPPTVDVASIITSLRASSGNQASVSALQIQPVTVINNTAVASGARLSFGEVEFSYNIPGSFNQLLTTLYNLQKTPRLINITKVILSKPADSAIILSVAGKAYFLK